MRTTACPPRTGTCCEAGYTEADFHCVAICEDCNIPMCEDCAQESTTWSTPPFFEALVDGLDIRRFNDDDDDDDDDLVDGDGVWRLNDGTLIFICTISASALILAKRSA